MRSTARSSRPTGTRHAQRGIALVVCLVFLLVLTLIGVTAMRTTGLEERMAGNARNGEIAFQAAEAGLREGEQWVMDIDLYNPPAPVDTCTTDPCDLWEANATGLPDYLYQQNLGWWQTTGREFGTAGSLDIAEAGTDPRYVVEYLGYDPGNSIIDADERAQQIGPHFYRATAAGFGGDTAAQRVLQTTVRTNKN